MFVKNVLFTSFSDVVIGALAVMLKLQHKCAHLDASYSQSFTVSRPCAAVLGVIILVNKTESNFGQYHLAVYIQLIPIHPKLIRNVWIHPEVNDTMLMLAECYRSSNYEHKKYEIK